MCLISAVGGGPIPSESSQTLMTRLGVLTLILMTGLVVLVGITRLLGKPSTVPSILKPSPGCDVGCWNGIHINKTTMSEAETILHDSHFRLSIEPSTQSV